MIAALFPYGRRIDRGEYAIRLLVAVLLSVPVLWWRWQVVGHSQTESLLFIAALVVLLVLVQAQTIARLHDADASILFSVLVYIPYLNAAFALALLFLPSRAPRPQFGDGVAGPTA